MLVLQPEDLAWMVRLRCLRFLSVTTTDEGDSWAVLCILGLMLPGLLFSWGGRPHWGWETDKALLPGGWDDGLDEGEWQHRHTALQGVLGTLREQKEVAAMIGRLPVPPSP